MAERVLSRGERAVLDVIRAHYGPRNTPEEVFYTSEGEAVISVTDKDGVAVLMANLTNLADWLADGSIASETDLLQDWLRVGS